MHSAVGRGTEQPAQTFQSSDAPRTGLATAEEPRERWHGSVGREASQPWGVGQAVWGAHHMKCGGRCIMVLKKITGCIWNVDPGSSNIYVRRPVMGSQAEK